MLSSAHNFWLDTSCIFELEQCSTSRLHFNSLSIRDFNLAANFHSSSRNVLELCIFSLSNIGHFPFELLWPRYVPVKRYSASMLWRTEGLPVSALNTSATSVCAMEDEGLIHWALNLRRLQCVLCVMEGLPFHALTPLSVWIGVSSGARLLWGESRLGGTPNLTFKVCINILYIAPIFSPRTYY